VRRRTLALCLAGSLAIGVGLGSCVRNADTSGPRIDSRKQEITALWTQIRDWRVDAGMRVEPEPRTKLEMRGQPMDSALKVCPEQPAASSDRCADVCDLADAICENAERICELADELGPDPWAKDKCESAKASCREAKQRCCDCDGAASAWRPEGNVPSAPVSP
jgi:hypothetical protein